MTDLTEMVEWLTATVRGDLERAKEAAEHPQLIQPFTGDLSDEEVEEIRERLKTASPAKLVVLDEPVTVSPRDLDDTIARCEAELEIIDEYAAFKAELAEPGGTVLDPTSIDLMLDGWMRKLAYARRHPSRLEGDLEVSEPEIFTKATDDGWGDADIGRVFADRNAIGRTAGKLRNISDDDLEEATRTELGQP